MSEVETTEGVPEVVLENTVIDYDREAIINKLDNGADEFIIPIKFVPSEDNITINIQESAE